ncbi:MAG: AAA family ATPase [Acidobacteria bacterium]|nr:AAA family ATPase [Acidobacteriota bacterium]
MYSSIRIQGYRGLDSFQMQGLGRVNLLVGTNNCGKTSILECIELLRSAGDPHVLSWITDRRGEWAYADQGDARNSPMSRRSPIVSHLFANRELGSPIRIDAERVGGFDPVAWNDRVTLCVRPPSDSERDEQSGEPEGDHDARLVLHVKWSDSEDDYRAFVNDEGLLPASQLRRAVHPGRGFRLGPWRHLANRPVEFVRTTGVTVPDVVETFSEFVLTPKEEAITQALRIVEPTIERIAPVPNDRSRHNRDAPGGMVLKLRDVADRVPIGSMGDGLWRMLGLALSIANAEGGVLLVDEIDTGLHYSVMEDMWRMINKQAAALSVQVFATSHSRDCYESLAAIADSGLDGATIQRIERSRGKAVRISREALVAVAERNIEVR